MVHLLLPAHHPCAEVFDIRTHGQPQCKTIGRSNMRTPPWRCEASASRPRSSTVACRRRQKTNTFKNSRKTRSRSPPPEPDFSESYGFLARPWCPPTLHVRVQLDHDTSTQIHVFRCSCIHVFAYPCIHQCMCACVYVFACALSHLYGYICSHFDVFHVHTETCIHVYRLHTWCFKTYLMLMMCLSMCGPRRMFFDVRHLGKPTHREAAWSSTVTPVRKS